MSDRRLVSYITSIKHITGCALAAVAPLLAVAGVLTPPVALALLPSLYVIGVAAAPTRRPVHDIAGVDPRDIHRCLRRLDRRVIPRLPNRVRVRAFKLVRRMNDLLMRAETLGAGSVSQYTLVRCATDYLPTALQAYLDLPRRFADHHVVADGKTPLALLSDQLDVVEGQLDHITENLNGAHSAKLIANGRFLAQKFGRGPLDIDRLRTDSPPEPDVSAGAPSRVRRR